MAHYRDPAERELVGGGKEPVSSPAGSCLLGGVGAGTSVPMHMSSTVPSAGLYGWSEPAESTLHHCPGMPQKGRPLWERRLTAIQETMQLDSEEGDQ